MAMYKLQWIGKYILYIVGNIQILEKFALCKYMLR